MKLRAFLATLIGLCVTPWRTLAKTPPVPLVQVFPTGPWDLPGLTIKNSVSTYKIVSECDPLFTYWDGEPINNDRRNKFWGYRVDDPSKSRQLLCIHNWYPPLDQKGITFWK